MLLKERLPGMINFTHEYEPLVGQRPPLLRTGGGSVYFIRSVSTPMSPMQCLTIPACRFFLKRWPFQAHTLTNWLRQSDALCQLDLMLHFLESLLGCGQSPAVHHAFLLLCQHHVSRKKQSPQLSSLRAGHRCAHLLGEDPCVRACVPHTLLPQHTCIHTSDFQAR